MSYIRNTLRGTWFLAPLIGVILSSTSLQTGKAQDIGDITAGRKLADNWCSSCHVVGPAPARGVSNGAPTFAAIARMSSTTALSLRAFLQTPHSRMPDLHLSRDEIDDVAAYILSLRRG
jgi:cytochrome c